MRTDRGAALVVAVLALVGCGGHAQPAPTERPPRYVDGRTGTTLREADALGRLLEAPLIYVGERHDRPEDHAVQARIATLAAADETPLVLGFEMVSTPYQPALDAYAAGGDEASLLADTEWETRWGFDFTMYRPLFQLGRESHVRLRALNAPREQTRAIAREGLDALDADARDALPELVLDDAEHRAMIEAAFAGHPHMDADRLERFYAAQVVWDETMAAQVAAIQGASRILVFAGVMHVQPSAIPRRAARRGAPAHRVLMPLQEAELEDALEARAADVFFVTP